MTIKKTYYYIKDVVTVVNFFQVSLSDAGLQITHVEKVTTSLYIYSRTCLAPNSCMRKSQLKFHTIFLSHFIDFIIFFGADVRFEQILLPIKLIHSKCQKIRRIESAIMIFEFKIRVFGALARVINNLNDIYNVHIQKEETHKIFN